MKLTYTVDETAEVLGISKSSVYNLRNNGVIHQLTKLPGVLFSVVEVQNLAGIERGIVMIGLMKLAGFILLIGTPGSLELDNITLYEACLQGLLGIALLYSGIYIDKLKKAQ